MASEIKVDTIVNAGGDNDSGIDLATNDEVKIKTANTYHVVIDSASNMGLGTTSVNNIGAANRVLEINGGSLSPWIHFTNNTSGVGASDGHILGTEGVDTYHINRENGTQRFHTNNTERMRITSDGILLLGNTTTSDTSGVGFKARPTGSITGTFNTSASDTSGFHYYNTNGTNNGYRFYVRADGGVYNYSSANYNLSDEREKKNITDMGSYYEDFKKFKFRDFNYNTEEDSQPKKHGVIAQEVELVNSKLVGEDFKVKVDEDGKDVLRKGLKEEQFVMIGLKTLQETIVKLEAALARIDTLEAKVKKLESK